MAEPSGYVIRPLDASDGPLVCEMLYHAIHVPPGVARPPRDVVDRPELSRYVQDWGRRAGDLGFAALLDDTPVGAAWLRLLTGDFPGYGHVDDATPELSVALLPAHRGRGVGTQLFRALLDAASTRFPAVSLSVAEDNRAAELYRRLGFEAVSRSGTSVTMLRRFGIAGSHEGAKARRRTRREWRARMEDGG